jgi:polyhydroxyalkanoate synthesis regulator phasin
MLVLEAWEEIQDPVGQQWQKQANHFQAVITDMQAIVADTTSTPEEVAEAEQTIADMENNLKRLAAKHGVTPTS